MPSRKSATLLLLAVVTALGALLRLWGLRCQGLVCWDEAVFLQEARYLMAGARDLEVLAGGSAATPHSAGGQGLFTGRPFHSLLEAGAMTVLGDSAFSGQCLSALCGILTIPLVAALGTALFDRRAGLAAAVLLAACPLHVVYSRQALSVVDATLLYYAGILVWWRGLHRRLRVRLIACLLAGLLIGLAATTNYPLWSVVLLLPALEAVRGLPEESGGTRLLRMGAIGTGILLPAAIIQWGYRMLAAVSLQHGWTDRVPDYADQVRALLTIRMVRRARTWSA